MTRILILLVFTLFISSCSSENESSVDSSELLTEFIEPIPEFGINSYEYISMYQVRFREKLNFGAVLTTEKPSSDTLTF